MRWRIITLIAFLIFCGSSCPAQAAQGTRALLLMRSGLLKMESGLKTIRKGIYEFSWGLRDYFFGSWKRFRKEQFKKYQGRYEFIGSFIVKKWENLISLFNRYFLVQAPPEIHFLEYGAGDRHEFHDIKEGE